MMIGGIVDLKIVTTKLLISLTVGRQFWMPGYRNIEACLDSYNQPTTFEMVSKVSDSKIECRISKSEFNKFIENFNALNVVFEDAIQSEKLVNFEISNYTWDDIRGNGSYYVHWRYNGVVSPVEFSENKKFPVAFLSSNVGKFPDLMYNCTLGCIKDGDMIEKILENFNDR